VDKRIQLAVSMALRSTSRFRLGAVLAKRRRIISTGHNNMDKSHPQMQRFCKEQYTLGLHAEVHCALGVPLADLEGAELTVARVLRDGSIALARPCGVCREFLTSVGVRLVRYTTSSGVEELTL
jgi:deoxycytidylate deaminase